MTNQKNLSIEPHQTSGGELMGKTFLGIAMGGIIAVLLFLILSVIGGSLTSDLTEGTVSPVLPLLLIFSGFLASFIGNIGVAGLYSLFFSKRYGKASKTIGILLLTNGLLFIILLPVYLIFNSDINTLFMLLGFHIIISTFLSSQQIENVCNPNYCASALVGNTVSLAILMLIYGITWKQSAIGDIKNKLYLLLLLPSIISFSIIPFGLGIWEIIYRKFFEMGNNGFYTPSKGEMSTQEIEIEKKDDRFDIIEQDINVDIK